MRRKAYFPLSLAVALAAACGGDDGGDNVEIDAAVDAPDVTEACGAPETTISTYPATYEGTVLGDGDDLTVGEGACADERGYFGASGEDHVIALTGLTAGTTYVLELTTDEDIMMYVTATCDAEGPAAGSCLLLVDETTGDEIGEFVAPAGGAITLIIDTPDDVDLVDGAYTLAIKAAECVDSTDCTAAGEPICDAFECVQCSGAFDCTAAGTPVCDTTTSTCVAGGTMCTGDDAGEPDDGPAAARVLAYPSAVTPTVTAAAVCSLPGIEGDWYKVTATAAGELRVSASWVAADADLDFLVYDSTGAGVAQGIAEGAGPEEALVELPAAGDYFIEIYQYAPASAAAATAYTLTLALPECGDSFDCTLATEPVCSVGDCVAGPATCTGDDSNDTGTADDGPASARLLAGAIGTPIVSAGSICNSPSSEGDWFRIVTLTQGEGLTAELSWTGAADDPDLDVYIYDATGNLLGTSFWLNPEVVTLTYLPAGTYYLVVNRAGSAVAAASAYSLSVTRTAAQTCQTSTDCATTYSTQIYRGDCTGGTCQFLPAGAGAAGAACDSADDCTSGDCSYSVFESDAQDSVCTRTCTTTADCAALGAAFACSTGFSTNICLPTCTADLECGANLNSSTLDTGLPWNYYTCTVASGACSP